MEQFSVFMNIYYHFLIREESLYRELRLQGRLGTKGFIGQVEELDLYSENSGKQYLSIVW